LRSSGSEKSPSRGRSGTWIPRDNIRRQRRIAWVTGPVTGCPAAFRRAVEMRPVYSTGTTIYAASACYNIPVIHRPQHDRPIGQGPLIGQWEDIRELSWIGGWWFHSRTVAHLGPMDHRSGRGIRAPGSCFPDTGGRITQHGWRCKDSGHGNARAVAREASMWGAGNTGRSARTSDGESVHKARRSPQAASPREGGTPLRQLCESGILPSLPVRRNERTVVMRWLALASHRSEESNSRYVTPWSPQWMQ